MTKYKTKQILNKDLEALGVGAWILGTGGGGNPYYITLSAKLISQKSKNLATLLDPKDLSDDDTVCVLAFIGAPLPALEKLFDYKQLIKSLNVLEKGVNKKIDALISVEIGGMNGMVPIPISIATGLPIVDADLMGRAYPKLNMVSLAVNKEKAPKCALTDIRNNHIYVPKLHSWEWSERLLRAISVEMGALTSFAFLMSGKQVKESAIHYSVSKALNMGKAVLKAQKKLQDPVETLLNVVKSKLLFTGKIIDVERKIEAGYLFGKLVIKGSGKYKNDEMLIHFQNEFSIAKINGDVLVTVPDLICVLDSLSGEAVGSEVIRYGQKVSVIAMPADPLYLKEDNVDQVSPKAFGFDVEYKSVFNKEAK